MKSKGSWLIIICLVLSVVSSFAQKSRYGKVCGNPQIKCRNAIEAGDNTLAFEGKPGNSVIYESKPFYGIIIQSAKLAADDCAKVFNESKRISLQALFPKNKVFTYTCDETEFIYYSGVAEGVGFVAIYGGDTLAEAQRFLKTFQNGGDYKDAVIRKMRVQVNGT